MIVNVHPGEQRRPRRTTHRRRDVRVPELRPLLLDGPQRLRHEVQRAQLHVLVVGQDEHDVRLAFSGRRHRRQNRRLAAAADARHVRGQHGAQARGQEDGEERRPTRLHFRDARGR